MLGKIKNMKLRYKIGVGVATTAAIAAGGGAAFAYWTTTGSGGGSGTVASSNGSIALTATVGSGLAPGGSVGVTITAANTGTSNLYVTTVSEGTTPIAIDTTHANNGCQLSDFSLAGPTTTAAEVAAGASGVQVATDTLSMKNTDVSQDACKGATITLSYTSS